MANKIILKKSSVAGKVPLATDLDVGEVALNLADKYLYSKDVGGTVIQIGGSGSMVYPGAGIPNSTGSAWGTSYNTTGANSVVLRDANQNITINSSFNGFTSVAASGTQITLTAASTPVYLITGSGGQTIKLPDATTLPNGVIFSFNNNQSSGAITVNNNSNTLIVSVPSGGYAIVVLLSNATAAGSWDRHDQTPSNVSWSTNTFDYAGSITSATWNGNVIALNRGGTNANLTAVNGGAVYSTGSALAITAAGISGQVLTSSGAGAPTWTTPTTGTVTSVTGTSPIASSGGATPAISISQSTTSTNGYLSSTDWNTFNGKQAAYTNLTTIGALANATGWLYNNGTGTFSYATPTASDVGAVPTSRTVSTTSPLTGGGALSSNLTLSMPAATTSASGYLTSTDWNTFNGKGSGTVTSVSALTLGTTGTDLSSTVATGTTTPVITLNVPTASASNRGALSAADWTTFNNKGSGTVTSVGGTGTVSGLTLTGTVTSTGNLTLGGTLTIASKMIYDTFTATASQTTFTTSATYTSGKIEVFANGCKMRNATDVTVTSGTSVVFATGLAVGTLVDLVYPT
jgi:hypothetical protein